MRQSIGKGNVRSLLGSPGRQLNEANCPATGDISGTIVKLYGAVTDGVGYVQNGTGGPVQVWQTIGHYRIYSNNGPLVYLKPYGRWRVSIKLEVFYPKISIGDKHDFLTCNLVRLRTDQSGNPTGRYDLIQKPGVILSGIPAGAQPTWTWDLTKGPFTFQDFVDVNEEPDYCFIGFDGLFAGLDPGYSSGTISGLQPYSFPPVGNSNSDPLSLFNSSGSVFSGPPPASPGDWDLPIEPVLAGGAIGLDGIYGRSSATAIQGLNNLYGVNGWGTPRSTWRATITAQRLSLTALFQCITASPFSKSVSFKNLTMAQGQAVNYLWSFGDGATSTLASPAAHTYANIGTFVVTLTATDDLGETSSFNQIIKILPTPLIADFTVIFFENSLFGNFTGIDKSTGAATWDWNMGDGTAHITTQNVSNYHYPKGNVFTVTLTVGDGTGKTASKSVLIST